MQQICIPSGVCYQVTDRKRSDHQNRITSYREDIQSIFVALLRQYITLKFFTLERKEKKHTHMD